MVDLVITAASVVRGDGAKVLRGDHGETNTAGQVVYRDATSKNFLKADNDSATAAVRDAIGIALNGGSNGQPAAIQYEGEINLGAILTVGETYCLSSNAGGICPIGDLASGDYPVILGVARTAAILVMGIVKGGAAKP
ncbi:hypothetical protein [Bradyrhizobium retamae]|uniref:DUF2190 domain-containing protein n=1 Tax=Bradyrhizobium retamae TaxID=1300035 RepID=A0A0R3MAH6_9BRAD|nr:hypothetical protein [Bradyrhizobium retamae]KRR16865.1 hypothetical protein CQ13_36525 [Bradyrhizobium retamae]